jgi:hypothetical protein
MIEYTFDDLDSRASETLWNAYIDIDYGRSVPEKGYKGFKSFVKDVTRADLVIGTNMKGFKLYFRDEKQYIWFLLKWC